MGVLFNRQRAPRSIERSALESVATIVAAPTIPRIRPSDSRQEKLSETDKKFGRACWTVTRRLCYCTLFAKQGQSVRP